MPSIRSFIAIADDLAMVVICHVVMTSVIKHEDIMIQLELVDQLRSAVHVARHVIDDHDCGLAPVAALVDELAFQRRIGTKGSRIYHEIKLEIVIINIMPERGSLH
jgi:hypothetical protein